MSLESGINVYVCFLKCSFNPSFDDHVIDHVLGDYVVIRLGRIAYCLQRVASLYLFVCLMILFFDDYVAILFGGLAVSRE